MFNSYKITLYCKFLKTIDVQTKATKKLKTL